VKAIVNTGPNQVEWLEYPVPDPGPGQVRIRTGACGICATDLKMIGGWERTAFPVIPGHEWAGIVDAAGPGVDSDLVGRRCVGANVLSDGGEVGFEHPGGYGEYFVTEAANLHLLPEDFDLTVATLIEPLAVCVRGLRRLRYDGTSPVLVIGDGPIGLLVLMLLVHHGAQWIMVVGGRAGRLALASKLGATRTLNYHRVNDSLAAAIYETSGMRFPVVVEASGSGEAMSTALQTIAQEGKILMLGDYGQEHADFPWLHLILSEIELIGSNASAGAWPEAVRLAVSEHLPLARLVTHSLPAERFAKGLKLMREHNRDVSKVVLQWMLS